MPILAGKRRQVAIVTGASNGIGKATALVLAERRYDVGFTFRSDRESALRVADEIRSRGSRCAFTPLDLEDPDRAVDALSRLHAELGRVDVLVNNAAVDHRGLLLDDDLAAWLRVLNVDLLGPVELARAAAKHMIDQGDGGSIINVTSVLDQLPVSAGGAYCAAKAALSLATQVMALELASYGIRVNAVAPGHTSTPQNFGPEEIDPRHGDYPEIPLGRPAQAQEIAATIAYLASADAAYITGARLLADGGLTLRSGPETLETAVSYTPSAELPSTPEPE
jgi:NAD(P)-dependent dehydrogenase (short-subunit alcohol dehydrogenase family)